MRNLSILLMTAVLAVLPAVPATAQPGFVGAELQVNTSTLGGQRYPDVAAEPAGGFVVVWESESSPGGDPDRAVLLQRFASDGTPVASELQVNAYTTGFQRLPAVAVGPGGATFVVWQSAGSAGTDTSDMSIQGAVSGSELQVNTATLNRQRSPDVASIPATGDFVVVWHSRESLGDDSSSYSVQMRRFASDGTPYGVELQVNTFTDSYQHNAAVAASATGDFLVVWESDGSAGTDTAPQSVQGQLFLSDGTPRGVELQINEYTPSAQRSPAVAAGSGGTFLVAWSSTGGGTDVDTTSVRARLLDADGSALAAELQVNASTTGHQGAPTVEARAEGGFVVAWQSESSAGSDTSSYSVQARQVTADGSLRAAEFQVNTSTYAYQKYASVASLGPQGFVVAWESYESAGTDSSSYSVQMQRLTNRIFADGFESGNTSAWSVTVP